MEETWHRPRRGEIVWRRHIIVLFGNCWLVMLYALSWIAMAVGGYATDAFGMKFFLSFLFAGMLIASVWFSYHYEDWRDDMYILTSKEIIKQKRHPFVWDYSHRLEKRLIVSTAAFLGYGEDEEAPFLRWFLGCGNVVVYGINSKMVLEDVFHPHGVKRTIDSWLGRKKKWQNLPQDKLGGWQPGSSDVF